MLLIGVTCTASLGGVVISMPPPPVATKAPVKVTPLQRFGDADAARDRAGQVILQIPAGVSETRGSGWGDWDGPMWRGAGWNGWGGGWWGSPIIINNYDCQRYRGGRTWNTGRVSGWYGRTGFVFGAGF